jgi:hypothetical protein
MGTSPSRWNNCLKPLIPFLSLTSDSHAERWAQTHESSALVPQATLTAVVSSIVVLFGRRAVWPRRAGEFGDAPGAVRQVPRVREGFSEEQGCRDMGTSSGSPSQGVTPRLVEIVPEALALNGRACYQHKARSDLRGTAARSTLARCSSASAISPNFGPRTPVAPARREARAQEAPEWMHLFPVGKAQRG